METSKDFVDNLFSFFSLPLATIVRLLETNNNEQQQLRPLSSPFFDNIKNLYQSVQNLDSRNNPVYKQMLLHPKNPCEPLCMKLFMNIDDTEELSTKFFVCVVCNYCTSFQNIDCKCRKPLNIELSNIDFKSQNIAQDGELVREIGPMFLISDDLKIVPSSRLSSLQMLVKLGYSDLTQLEEITHNIGKHEIINLLKYTLVSDEPLTNTILSSSSKNKDSSPNRFASAVRVTPFASNIIGKMEIKVMQSKAEKNIIYAETNEDFVNFIFSFLTMPLGSIVKLLGVNSFAGCVCNLYESMTNFDATSVLLNTGIVQQFCCPNQPLNIPHVILPPPTKYYRNGGVISTLRVSIRSLLISLDPTSKEGVVGFVKKGTLYNVGDDLKVKQVSANFCFSYLKELSLPLDDFEVKVINIGEFEALSLLRACVTSNFTLTSGMRDFLDVPKQETT